MDIWLRVFVHGYLVQGFHTWLFGFCGARFGNISDVLSHSTAQHERGDVKLAEVIEIKFKDESIKAENQKNHWTDVQNAKYPCNQCSFLNFFYDKYNHTSLPTVIYQLNKFYRTKTHQVIIQRILSGMSQFGGTVVRQ